MGKDGGQKRLKKQTEKVYTHDKEPKMCLPCARRGISHKVLNLQDKKAKPRGESLNYLQHKTTHHSEDA